MVNTPSCFIVKSMSSFEEELEKIMEEYGVGLIEAFEIWESQNSEK